MSEARLLVETNRPNVILNLGIACALFVILFLFLFTYVVSSSTGVWSVNNSVAMILDNFLTIFIVAIPLAFLGKIIKDHILMINYGYIALLDDKGIKIRSFRHTIHVSWSDIVQFRVVNRIMLIGTDRSMRPGRRKIQTRKVSLRYSSITTDAIIRRVAYERPDLIDPSIRRDSLVGQPT